MFPLIIIVQHTLTHS